MYHISWNVSFPHKISIFSITFSIVMSKHSFFPSNCPILLYICSFAMACQESSYSTICSYLFLIFYNREMSRNKTNSYEMKSNYARFQILEPSKTIHTRRNFKPNRSSTEKNTLRRAVLLFPFFIRYWLFFLRSFWNERIVMKS